MGEERENTEVKFYFVKLKISLCVNFSELLYSL